MNLVQRNTVLLFTICKTVNYNIEVVDKQCDITSKYNIYKENTPVIYTS